MDRRSAGPGCGDAIRRCGAGGHPPGAHPRDRRARSLLTDPYQLQRFVDAQRPVYETVLSELRTGRKRTHWMWFIFPQLTGLGRSSMAQRFAISSLAEARAYLGHPVLGPRLRECATIVAGIEGRAIGDIFGAPDDRKFHSSMTLFGRAAPDEPVFKECLRRFFGDEDPETLARP